MTKTVGKIPAFKNIRAEADFWDSHDTTDFESEFKPVEVRFAKNLSDGLHVRFDPEDLTKIREEAQKKGIRPTTLIRMWVREHLHA
jgi:predicted DNA binding CopG/RHH family protein